MSDKPNILKTLFRNEIDCYTNSKLYYLYFFLTAVISIIGFLNLVKGEIILGVVSYINVLSLIIFILLLKFGKPRLSICGIILTFMLILTYYFVVGPNNGVAGIWVVIVPIAFSILINTFYSMIISTYFLILIIVCCFTPAKQFVYQYSPEFFSRFPFIYIASYIIGIFAGYHNQHANELQKNQIRILNSAVEEERKRNDLHLFQTLTVISNMVDAKDSYTLQHSTNVAFYAKKLALGYGLSLEHANRIYIAGLVHDIGKVNIPDDVLKKNGKLTDTEYGIIKRHPDYGYNIFNAYDGIEDIKDGILYHHERIDGKGYPVGLSDNEIPVIAKIISIADAYDAMTSDRCYRAKLSEKEVKRRLIAGAGTQFDLELVQIFIKLINKGELDNKKKI